MDAVSIPGFDSQENDCKAILHVHHQNQDSFQLKNDGDAAIAFGPCNDIEEASVDTAIQSVSMEEIGRTCDTGPITTTYPPSSNRNVLIRLTPEEEKLFNLLVHAAEAHEQGKLTIDPNPPQQSVSARGGFTKEESAGGEDASWLTPPPIVPRIEIRIAGGWVRDKLLNQHSSDVDVAVDCMMGVQFARIVQSYLAMQHQQEEQDEEVQNQKMEEEGNDKKKHSQKSSASKPNTKKNKQPKIGVIGANPSQSKHLETATMNIHGIDVDFVNLRAEEVYEADSRIPTSRTRMFGSPLEDALRRDFTINSLFYNIRSHKIEDWTGRGLNDLLEHRRVVTPVDANETFHDDPLRVLRAVRFCVRLDFALDDNIREAAMSKRVHHSLHVKVSRERVGKELEGMLIGKGARPGRALDMIAELHLAGSVFCFPGSFPGDNDFAEGGPVTGNILGVEYHGCCGRNGPEAVQLAGRHRERGWEESSKLLSLLPTVMEGHVDEREKILRERRDGLENEGDKLVVPSAADIRLLHLCVFILPFHSLTFPDAKGRDTPVTAHMIKEALKFPTRDIMAVAKILQHVDEMSEILSEIRSQMTSQQRQEGGADAPLKLSLPCRLRSGLLLRSLKEHWVTCLLTASVLEICLLQKINNESDEKTDLTNSAFHSIYGNIPAEQPSRKFYRSVVGDLDLDECWRVRPLFDGKAIITELGLPKGPLVGVYLDDQIRWMLLNPNGTKEECMTHLEERKRDREQECISNNPDENGNNEEGKDTMVIDDQNEITVGVANGEGHSSPIAGSDVCANNGTKHFSKKMRAENINI